MQADQQLQKHDKATNTGTQGRCRSVENPYRNNYLYQELHAANQISSHNNAFVESTFAKTQHRPFFFITELFEVQYV